MKPKWSEIFDRLCLYTASRTEVINLLHADGQDIIKHTIFAALGKLRQRRCPEILAFSDTYLADEFPELIDDEILPLCQKINSSGFSKTTNGCSGHALHSQQIDKVVTSKEYGKFIEHLPYPYGYFHPYLTIMFDENDSRSREARNSIDQGFSQFATIPGVLLSTGISTQAEHMSQNGPRIYPYSQKDFSVKECSYFACFFPQYLVSGQKTVTYDAILDLMHDKLTNGELREFALSKETHERARQFFMVFDGAFS